MRRALVIAPNWIGDALMAQPLFARLVKLHPRIVIDAVAPSWVAPVLERMPEIRDVYATDLAHGKLQMLRRWQLASDLRDVGYDAAYVLPNSLKSALIPWMAGIPLRIGYTGESRYGLLNVRHANPRKDERPPMVGHYAALAYAPGAKVPDDLPMPRLDADLNEASRVSARFNLDTRVPLLVFCPGAEYGPAKRWPPEHFAALAQLRLRLLLFLAVVVAEFIGQMRGDGLAFAVRVRRQVDHVGRQRKLLQLGQNFFFSGMTTYSVLNASSTSTPRLLLGKSFTWPKEASTVNPLPRYF